MEYLILNGKKFSAANLQDIPTHLAASCGNEMADEIRIFLREWWGGSGAIRVKTSGSTGTPQTKALSKKMVEASADLTIAYFGLDKDCKALLCLSCRFIAGKLMLVRAIRSGMALVVKKPSLDVLSEPMARIDFAALIPGQVQFALEHTAAMAALQSISQVLIGGGPIDAKMEIALHHLPNRFLHSYGMTETATHVALRDISAKKTYYTALEGVYFSLDNRDCLLIHADHLPSPVVTNDLIKLLDKYRFRWLGRLDHAIISGGLKFLPEILEQKMAPYIDGEFFITAKPEPVLGHSIELVVQGKPWGEGQFKNLIEKLKEVLTAYEIPKSIRFVNRFERTPTGKIKRV